MITFNDFTNGFTSICSQFFVFNSRTSVSYVVRDNCRFIVEYATIFDHITHTSRCVSRVNNVFYCSESNLSLVDDICSSDPDLLRRYNVVSR